ncbi:transcriptional repressor CTCF [Musca domestica]|uniref:Transcriptional repressor CTCF n=1 Tax=Musca domestica TaxID=7370 RepID=A0A9J7I2G4_MUSDO|nr:transcriptional repressor CTCF [Musca domestica]
MDSKYADYLICGEIFKSPAHSNKTPYILKCHQCSDIFLLLESFIFHIEDYCKPIVKAESTIPKNVKAEKLLPQNSFTILDDTAVVVKNEPIIDVEFEATSMMRKETTVKGLTTNLNDTNKVLDECTGFLKVETNAVPETGDGSSTDEAEEGNDEMMEVYEVVEECESEDDDDKTTTDDSTPSFVAKFMESRTHVIALITSYKKLLQEKGLKGHAEDNGLKSLQQSDWNKLTRDINSKCHLNVSSEDVANILEYFYQQYREYLMCLTDTKATKYSKPRWYFEYLDFLDTPKEGNILQIDEHPSILSQEEIIEIIDIYKGYPFLWNTDLAEYCCTNPRHEALENMLWTLEVQLKIKVSQNALKKYIRCLHNYFQKEKVRRMRNTNLKHLTDVLYNKMDFLSKHIGPFRCSECNLEVKCPFTLKIHKFGIHGGDLPFTCSTCHTQFRSLNSYVFHAKKHVQDLSIECKICDKRFLHSYELKKHMFSHNEYKSSSNEKDKLSPANVAPNRRLKTTVTISSPTTTAIKSAVEPSTSTFFGPLMCKICGIHFKARKSLNQHLKMHQNK